MPCWYEPVPRDRSCNDPIILPFHISSRNGLSVWLVCGNEGSLWASSFETFVTSPESSLSYSTDESCTWAFRPVKGFGGAIICGYNDRESLEGVAAAMLLANGIYDF